MRLPVKRPRAPMELKIPDLAGGLNLRDGLSEILDNQLTDCKNVWWNDGILTTRPSFKQEDELMIGRQEYADAQVKRHNCYFDEEGKRGQLCSVRCGYKLNDTTTNLIYETYIDFFWVFDNYQKRLPAIYVKTTNFTNEKYFVCRKKNILYCFTNARKVYMLDTTKENTKWKEVPEEDYYVPLIATNCKSVGGLSTSIEDTLASGVQIESYNLLGSYYKVTYDAFNIDISSTDSSTNKKYHNMMYSLLNSTWNEKYVGKKVTATFKKKQQNGSFVEGKHEITLQGKTDAGWVWESDFNSTDGLKMGVFAQQLQFKQKTADGGEEIARIYEDDNTQSNLEVTAPFIPSDEEYGKVFDMTQCEWFGGSATGISGGTRLFLCGNTSDPSLVIWSGLNDPLYFPENAYFYVGDTSSAVMGFGKQSDMLVIFKENETWYTQYQQNTNITAENLINQSVIDYASSSVYFPLIQINSNIGCGYPETIELCRNRLVWLGSNGNVYTLVSENQYNERSIFCVSEMIKNSISKSEGIKLASSCDWNGYYCLLVDNKVYLMDYNCYGYTHIASYSKTEDANIRIPWYIWEINFGGRILSVGDKLAIADFGNHNESTSKVSFYKSQLDSENCYDELIGSNGEIVSSFTTKLFDFSQPHIRKNIEQINIQLGNNNGNPIKVFFITESGVDETNILTQGNETKNYTAGYIESCAVFPCIKQALRFALKIESKGRLAVDSMILKYRSTGGAR